MPANIWRKIQSFYNLKGTKCTACSSLFFPAEQVCMSCGLEKMEMHEFSGTGKITTFTVIRQQFNDDGERTQLVLPNPYTIAIIELDEGPMITAQIADANQDEIEIGQRVHAVFRKISEQGAEGIIKYGYKFIIENK